MKYILVLLFLLTGCQTVPVTVKFPQAPTILQNTCNELKLVPDNAKLSDVTRTVVENYSEYYLCAETVNGWQDWYVKQKKLFEAVK
jgi:hypothetical protein